MRHHRPLPRRIALGAAGLAAALLGLAPGLAAQPGDEVVKAKGLVSRDAVRPGETFKVAAVLAIQAGYHINDNAPLDEFMIPTVFVIADDPDFEVVEILYPKGRRARFSYSDAELVVYEGEAVLGALVKAKTGLAPGPRVLKCALSYQACNDQSCLPPKEIPFEVAVPVAVGGQGTDLHPEVFGKLRFQSLKK